MIRWAQVALLVGCPVALAQPCSPEWLYDLDQGIPGVLGAAATVTEWDPDGSGPQLPALIVGGNIHSAGLEDTAYIAMWNGSQWTSLGTGINPPSGAVGVVVRALRSWNGDLIVGGVFPGAGGVAAKNIVRWDGQQWHAMGAPMTGVTFYPLEVDDLLPLGNSLIASGAFLTIGGVPANCIASWNGAAWQPIGSGLLLSNERIATGNALVLHGSDVIVGGRFTSAGGVSANNVARWDGVSWHPMGSGLSLRVYDLTSDGVSLFAATAQPYRVVRWDGSGWQPLGSDANDLVMTIIQYGGELFAGGYFGNIGGIPASRIARWNGSAWTSVGGGVSGGPVLGLGIFGGHLVAAGGFNNAGPTGANGVARWDGATWHVIGGGFNQSVTRIAELDDGLVMAGGFTCAGGLPASGIAARTSGGWWIPPAVSGGQARIDAMIEHERALIIGGSFAQAGSAPAKSLARWEGTGWSEVGGGVTYLGQPGTVQRLITLQNQLLVGGTFDHAGTVLANSLALWDGAAWTPFGPGLIGINFAPSPVVECAMPHESSLIVGGALSIAGAPTPQYIAMWSGSSWQPMGPGFNDRVLDLGVYQDAVFAAGRFSAAGSTSLNGIARWNGVSWQPLGAQLALGSRPNALAVQHGVLYVAGGFSQPYSRIASWDGSQWHGLGTGLDFDAYDLVAHHNEVIAVGMLQHANGKTSNYWARWGCPPCYPDCNQSGTFTIADFGCFQSAFAAGCP